MVTLSMLFFFFFQAEDGIRDLYVTGVQTCALPICMFGAGTLSIEPEPVRPLKRSEYDQLVELGVFDDERIELIRGEIGRASCRERVEVSVGAVALKKKKQVEEKSRQMNVTAACLRV